jgi:hypothetical protein
LGTFRLKIEQFWPFEEISIFSNGAILDGGRGYWPFKMAAVTKNRNFFNCPLLI